MGLTRAPEDRPTPPEVYNIRVYLLAIICCLGSWVFGFPVGSIGGVIVLPSFQDDFHLPAVGSHAYNNVTSNIISLFQVGGLIGSMAMFPGMKVLGRKFALAASAAVAVVGAVLQTFSHGRLGMMYAGRLVTGIGAGCVTVVVPLYLAELSPPAVRGSIVGIYEINNQLSSLLGYWCNYIVNLYIPPTATRQWQIPLAMQLVPSSLLLMAALFIIPESPRFLVNKNKQAEARKVLSFVRHLPQEHEYINSEIADFETAHQNQLRAKASSKGHFGLVRELAWKGNRNRVLIGIGLMVFQNLTGINGVNFYTATIFRSIGFQGTNAVLLASGMFAVVKTIATLASLLLLIDRAGRRKLLLISAAGVSLSLWYIGGYIFAANIVLGETQTRTAGGWVAIVAVYTYAASFSIAWNGVVWVYASEIFPGRIKELAVCLTTFTQWLSAFGVARASPYMLSSLRGGFFFFFAASMVVAALFVFFGVPETKGKSLERMDEIFGTPYSGELGARFGVLEAGMNDLEKADGKDPRAESGNVQRVRSAEVDQVGISAMGRVV
ncbi:hypothetical protein BP5796_08930 [Coleophoma crateriformis]|uniref:Quinate transporter n=1 Tax=Coleophoma crateriformis TaxID=565419 RepID=A0A3D8R2J9_9HELO|nr:hypothetical protein BP5796_08930 [Coleophoma crateriformis]